MEDSQEEVEDIQGCFVVDICNIAVVKSRGRKSDITPERLAQVFNITRDTAVRTLRTTTRYCPRNVKDITLNKRYSNNDRMLRYNRMLTDLFTDTMFATKSATSLRGYTCAQVFATPFGWAQVVLLKHKSEVHLAVKDIFKRYGASDNLIYDKPLNNIKVKHYLFVPQLET